MKMKKKNLFAALISIIISVAFLQVQGNKKTVESNISVMQIGAGAIYASFASDWEAGDKAAAGTAGTIVSGVGVSMIQASVPASMTPVGWYGIAAGLIL